MTASLLCLLHQLADLFTSLFDGDEFAIRHIDLALHAGAEGPVPRFGVSQVRDQCRVQLQRRAASRVEDNQHQHNHEGLPSSPPSSSRTRALRAFSSCRMTGTYFE